MKTIPYNELDWHFTVPRLFNEKPHFNYKKFPRKLKKKLKKVNCPVGDLNTKMWFILEPNYKRFLIKQICKNLEN